MGSQELTLRHSDNLWAAKPLSRQRLGGGKQVGPRLESRGAGLDQPESLVTPRPEIEAHGEPVEPDEVSMVVL